MYKYQSISIWDVMLLPLSDLISGRLFSAQEELWCGRAAAVHTGGVLQQPSLQHPSPVHRFHQTVCFGERKTRRGGKNHMEYLDT